MQRLDLSFKGLEIFQLVAKTGSVQKVAGETGLSVSTVSHHLRNLEDHLGANLLDHSRRPMLLTPAGAVFLRYVEDGLSLIRRGENELTSGNLTEVRDFRLGMVDDFENDVTPELVRFLAEAMPRCNFKHHTRPSHEIIALLAGQKLDMGVAARPVSDVSGVIEYPLLRDPFVLAVPVSSGTSAEDFLAGASKLPLLRYTRNQYIGSVIEAHLRRLRISLPNRFEFESNQSILSMVAEGIGWAITTPASFARAKRFHGRITLYPFPGKGFVRYLSLFAAEDYPQSTAETIAAMLRRLISRHFVDHVTQSNTWLATDFRILAKGEDPV